MKYFTVFATVPNSKTAKTITKILLTKKLCACVSIIKNADSFYWWNGEITRSKELLLVMKTSSVKLAALEKQIKAVHPYEVPEIVAVKIDFANKDYLDWIKKYAG